MEEQMKEKVRAFFAKDTFAISNGALIEDFADGYARCSIVLNENHYNAVGGAPLLGVNGAVVKAHGSSGAEAIENAIRQARRMLEGDVVGKIQEGLKVLEEN